MFAIFLVPDGHVSEGDAVIDISKILGLFSFSVSFMLQLLGNIRWPWI